MPNVDEILAGARDAMTVKRVFGDPVDTDGVTVIPVARVGGGGGAEATKRTTAGLASVSGRGP